MTHTRGRREIVVKRRLILAACTSMIFAPFAANIYLMENRPVVAVGSRFAAVPADWLCGRVYSGPYCVEITERDRHLEKWSLLLFMLVGLPALLRQMPDVLKRQRSRLVARVLKRQAFEQ